MITTITSKTNDKIVLFGKLKQKKYRDITNQAILEGQRLVMEAIERKAKIVALLISQDCEKKYLELLDENKFNIYVLSSNVYNSVALTENSQGIIAIVEFAEQKLAEPNGKFLILDNISDPGNMGTIIRTALAGGIKDIYCINCVDYRNEKVLRSTMGTIFDVMIYNIDYDIAKRLMSNYTTFVTEMRGENIYSIVPPKGIYGVVMGNEANGVSNELLCCANRTLSIPMLNNVESLNVAVATAVIIYILNNKGE